MAEIQGWFNGLPRFTRYWFGGTVALSLAARFGIIPAQWMVLSADRFLNKFEIWRPITALFFYPISPQTGFHFLINLYFLVNYSRNLETGVFEGVPADYAFLLLFSFLVSVVTGLFMGLSVLMDPMVMCVLYIYCQLNKDVIVNFWFGTQFPAMYLPWVLCAFNMIIGGGGMMELMGILIGHLYFFLKFQYNQQYGGPALVETPRFLETWLPSRRQQRPAAAAGGAPPPTGGHRWGTGQSLGGS
jgi:derlin-1